MLKEQKDPFAIVDVSKVHIPLSIVHRDKARGFENDGWINIRWTEDGELTVDASETSTELVHFVLAEAMKTVVSAICDVGNICSEPSVGASND